MSINDCSVVLNIINTPNLSDTHKGIKIKFLEKNNSTINNWKDHYCLSQLVDISRFNDYELEIIYNNIIERFLNRVKSLTELEKIPQD